MMSVDLGRPWTYDDYAALPDDGKRYEIVHGVLYEMPAANTRHQDIVVWVLVSLYTHVRDNGLGRVYVAATDVVLSSTNVVQPDVLFLADAVTDRITKPNIQGPPTLAVEVLSDPRHDRVRKRALYEDFGVEEYWIVDAGGEKVEVYTLRDRRYGDPSVLRPGDTLTTGLLPGLSIDVGELLSAGLA